MAYQKLVGQPQRCLIPIPSDTVPIPCPAYFKYTNDSIASGGAANILKIHPGEPSFVEKGVKVGDIVYNETLPGASTVTAIVGPRELELVATGIDFTLVNQKFNIWGPERVPCVLMAMGNFATNALRVTTQDGVILNLVKAPPNERLPFGQITLLNETGTTGGATNRGYLAMW
tara:strand:+ start:4648 stop:5166 length:519 start_codon:yes stop_codon:yes gene_type:complete